MERQFRFANSGELYCGPCMSFAATLKTDRNGGPYGGGARGRPVTAEDSGSVEGGTRRPFGAWGELVELLVEDGADRGDAGRPEAVDAHEGEVGDSAHCRGA